MYKHDLALNNPQWLIYHKNQTTNYPNLRPGKETARTGDQRKN